MTWRNKNTLAFTIYQTRFFFSFKKTLMNCTFKNLIMSLYCAMICKSFSKSCISSYYPRWLSLNTIIAHVLLKIGFFRAFILVWFLLFFFGLICFRKLYKHIKTYVNEMRNKENVWLINSGYFSWLFLLYDLSRYIKFFLLIVDPVKMNYFLSFFGHLDDLRLLHKTFSSCSLFAYFLRLSAAIPARLTWLGGN